LDALNIHAP